MSRFAETITDIRHETHDVKTFRITRPSDFSFIPGQYCLVSFVGNPKFLDESKPFTFSSSPLSREYLELTVKRMGDFTNELFRLEPGDKLGINGPIGESLNFDESVKDDVVFLAGGSGITPFMSAIRYAVSMKLPNKMALFFSNRTEADIIFRDELGKIGLAHDNIRIINTLTDVAGLAGHARSEWKGETGYITKEMMQRYLKPHQDYGDNKGYMCYVCGPPAMSKAMQKILKDQNINDERIRIEPWEIPGKRG